jgi:hypothetical protein
MHYRDETTNRPLKFSSYPNLSANASTTNQLTPAATGTAGDTWDVPHHPSVGFMAYVITGRWYFLEELQFAATYNYLWQVDGGQYANRNHSDGIFDSASGGSSVRGAAWANRTLLQAASVTPDADSLAPEFIASLTANINFNHRPLCRASEQSVRDCPALRRGRELLCLRFRRHVWGSILAARFLYRRIRLLAVGESNDFCRHEQQPAPVLRLEG